MHTLIWQCEKIVLVQSWPSFVQYNNQNIIGRTEKQFELIFFSAMAAYANQNSGGYGQYNSNYNQQGYGGGNQGYN